MTNDKKQFIEKKIMRDIMKNLMNKTGYELIAMGRANGANANDLNELRTILETEKNEEYWNFVARESEHVLGEWEIYLNDEIFCHLCDSGLDDFINSCKYTVKVEEKK